MFCINSIFNIFPNTLFYIFHLILIIILDQEDSNIIAFFPTGSQKVSPNSLGLPHSVMYQTDQCHDAHRIWEDWDLHLANLGSSPHLKLFSRIISAKSLLQVTHSGDRGPLGGLWEPITLPTVAGYVKVDNLAMLCVFTTSPLNSLSMTGCIWKAGYHSLTQTFSVCWQQTQPRPPLGCAPAPSPPCPLQCRLGTQPSADEFPSTLKELSVMKSRMQRGPLESGCCTLGKLLHRTAWVCV